MRSRGSYRQRATLVGTVDEEVLAFTAGKDIHLDLELAEVDCLGTAAHVTMLARLPVRPPILHDHDRRRVIRELIRILQASALKRLRIRPEDQDIHLAIERRLTETLGALGRKVHTGRSRNDQIATDLRLYAKQHLLGLKQEVADLAEGFLRFARRYQQVPMVGRTHFQPAMPSSVGLWASAFAEGLLDDLFLLDAAYELNDRCPLGAAAGYGVPLPLDRELTARLLGFRAPVHNVLHAVNSRGQVEAAILSALGQLMITLSRWAEDIVLFTAPEFGYFTLPEGYFTGSSLMPQKRNPDVAELLRARTARVLAYAAVTAEIVRRLPSGYQRDVQEIKEPFLEGLRTVGSAVRIVRRITEGLTVNAGRLRSAFTPELFAADHALWLAAAGVPFRDAYQKVRTETPHSLPSNWERAVFAKAHLGAPGGLNLEALRDRARRARTEARAAQRRFHQTLSHLLGVTYPLSFGRLRART